MSTNLAALELVSELFRGFENWLTENGFVPSTIRKHLINVAHWCRFLSGLGIVNTADLRSEHLVLFLETHLQECQCPVPGNRNKSLARNSLNRFCLYLKHIHHPITDTTAKPNQSKVIKEYLDWLRDYRNCLPRTVASRSRYILILFKEMMPEGKSPEDLTRCNVHRFCLSYAQGRSPSLRQGMQSSLRTFLMFCYTHGYTTENLSMSVPSLRTYRLGKIPRGTETEKLVQLISGITLDTEAKIRDRAMLLILFTYGVRGGQVRGLCFDDIDWRANRIRFKAMKRGREIYQPLTIDVGNSLLRYLEDARPYAPYSEIFMTAKAPYHPLSSTALSQAVRTRFIESGIKAQFRGSHVFRHSFATNMLRHGQSLETIADMLGHRSLESTYQYTKVDFQSLNEVSSEWVEVAL